MTQAEMSVQVIEMGLISMEVIWEKERKRRLLKRR
jgi:hypothetical protein